MFNPVYEFTNDVLDATLKRGCIYFVRNYWKPGFDHFHDEVKPLIISHYDDRAKAEAHFNSLGNDVYRYLYDSSKPEHLEKLRIAATQPAGYKIYSTYFLSDYKNKIHNRLKEKINKWMYRNTNWKPGKGETVNVDFYMQFGHLHAKLTYGGNERKTKFEEIENSH